MACAGCAACLQRSLDGLDERRLKGVGLRPINALVDITNYVTFDRGRPLHVFDAAKVTGDLVVRRARAGETILALDGKTYELDPHHVVIADENGPESIAGVMGGEHSGCDETTTDVLIESALWDPLNIAQTGRRLGIVTDARYRFERGVDPNDTLPGLDLATRLVLEICGGEATRRTLVGEIPDTSRIIHFPWSETKRLSGLDVPAAEAKGILVDLGFHVSSTGDSAKVLPPSWRPDVEGKADLVEEVVRIAGLDRIAPQPLGRDRGVSKPVLTLIQKRTRAQGALLAARGLLEPLLGRSCQGGRRSWLAAGDPSLELAKPDRVRHVWTCVLSLLPGLIKTVVSATPIAASATVAAVRGRPVLPRGARRGGARPCARPPCGAERPGSGRRPALELGSGRAVDVFDAKADALASSPRSGSRGARCRSSPGGRNWLHPGRSGRIQLGPKAVFGYFAS